MQYPPYLPYAAQMLIPAPLTQQSINTVPTAYVLHGSGALGGVQASTKDPRMVEIKKGVTTFETFAGEPTEDPNRWVADFIQYFVDEELKEGLSEGEHASRCKKLKKKFASCLR